MLLFVLMNLHYFSQHSLLIFCLNSSFDLDVDSTHVIGILKTWQALSIAGKVNRGLITNMVEMVL